MWKPTTTHHQTKHDGETQKNILLFPSHNHQNSHFKAKYKVVAQIQCSFCTAGSVQSKMHKLEGDGLLLTGKMELSKTTTWAEPACREQSRCTRGKEACCLRGSSLRSWPPYSHWQTASHVMALYVVMKCVDTWVTLCSSVFLRGELKESLWGTSPDNRVDLLQEVKELYRKQQFHPVCYLVTAGQLFSATHKKQMLVILHAWRKELANLGDDAWTSHGSVLYYFTYLYCYVMEPLRKRAVANILKLYMLLSFRNMFPHMYVFHYN